MRFFIDHNDGHSIRGWIVPDNPLAVGRVVVSVEGRRVAQIEASIVSEEFQRNGWHATGQCVFLTTEAEVPGLSEIHQAVIHQG